MQRSLKAQKTHTKDYFFAEMLKENYLEKVNFRRKTENFFQCLCPPSPQPPPLISQQCAVIQRTGLVPHKNATYDIRRSASMMPKSAPPSKNLLVCLVFFFSSSEHGWHALKTFCSLEFPK